MTLACPNCRKPGALLNGNCTRCGRSRTPQDLDLLRVATDSMMRETNKHRATAIEFGGIDR